MKKILALAVCAAATLTSYSQALEYEDLAILFSKNHANGSARFNAMSGAFGALGGDISAITINPASGAIFNNSAATITGTSRETSINSNYYGNTSLTQGEYFNLSQAGAVLVFDSNSSDWDKFALTFNYSIQNDFENNFIARGNSGVATFQEFPLDSGSPVIQYSNSEEQQFINNYKGKIDEYNFGFSAAYERKLYIGASINTYNLNFTQQATLRERNNDGSGNVLNADFYQQNVTTGTGFSLGAGFIYKAHPNFRIGLAYQTPTWYTEIVEETNITNNDGFMGDTEISVSGSSTIYNNTTGGFFPTQGLNYRLKTPSKVTASAALLFGKHGLISVDYTRKNFQKVQLSNSDFTTENQSIFDNYRNTASLNVGTEWRLDKFSIRGGYRYEQSPDKNAIDSDNLKGYSFGAGYNFGDFKIDLAYSDRNRTSLYNFYPQANFNVNPTDLNIDNKVITATLTFNL